MTPETAQVARLKAQTASSLQRSRGRMTPGDHLRRRRVMAERDSASTEPGPDDPGDSHHPAPAPPRRSPCFNGAGAG